MSIWSQTKRLKLDMMKVKKTSDEKNQILFPKYR